MKYRFSSALAELKPSAIREIFKSLTDPSVIAFAAGNPNADSFPQRELALLAADILEREPITALQYGTTEGYTPLRRHIAERIKKKEGIGRDFDDTIIVSGGEQGLELTCKAFCDDGDVVLCEDPSFVGALNAFRSCGARLCGIPMDEDGISPEAFERAIDENPRAKLLYIIPTFQNPSGRTTSYERRRAIYEVASRRGVIILEDNPYGELRFSGENIPTIKSMDDAGVVVYCSSFSKLLSSGLRVGYVTAPEEIVKKIVVGKQGEDVHTSMLSQMMIYRYMTEYDFEAHVASVASLYGRKCGVMMDALEKYMPAAVSYTRPCGGLFVWCTLPDSIDSGEYIRRAMAEKVAVVPGQAFCADTEAHSQSFRITYSTPSDEEIVRGVEILGRIANEMLT